MAENPKFFEPCNVSLWVPVREGPCAQAVPKASGIEGTRKCLQPTCPLPDGVYCLHTGALADAEPPPQLSCPFVVRGYGVPEIKKAVAEIRGGDAVLTLVVRNTGRGEFNDGLLVVHVQKQLSTWFTFEGRSKDIDMAPIPAQREGTIELAWKTADWKPGTYCFSGTINNRQLRDANKLASFDTDNFVIAGDLPVRLPDPPRKPGPPQSPRGALTADLRCSMNEYRWHKQGFHPQALPLSDFPIDKGWIEPPAGGAKRLYGVARFGEATELKVIVDLNDRGGPLFWFAFDDDIRFDNKPAPHRTR